MKKKYDVVIMGGGLAGLTLAMQLKQADPLIDILILERRDDAAPDAAHKVGESTVELGSYYLREVLGLKEYLEEHQLPKHGLRFFFTPQHKEHIENRAELGTRERLPVPSHQVDRGIFENVLIQKNRALGIDIVLGARVRDIVINPKGHTVQFRCQDADVEVEGTWVVDSTGRHGLLKRKLGFAKPLAHDINAAWFRLNDAIDVDDWSEDDSWRSKVKPGLRRLGTVHLMGKGYWVWLIPLVSGSTSIGIVADPDIHPLDSYNSFDKAMDWLSENEPLCGRMLAPKRDLLLDFKVMKHYAHDSGRFYSADRWAVTGEAGAFLDPFYSPGTDFIAISNTWVNDLICRDLNGESIAVRASVYEQTHAAMFQSWVPIYQNMYPLMGCTQLMIVKIFWDWGIYWGLPTFLFVNESFTDMDLLRKLSISSTSVLQRLARLNSNMQRLFLDWAPHDEAVITDIYIDPYDLGFLRDFHLGMDVRHEPDDLMKQVTDNMDKLERIAAEIFRRVSAAVNGTPDDMMVCPYTASLTRSEPAPDGLGVDDTVRDDVDLMFF